MIDVEWRFQGETEYYRIHYADPNMGFNCGWHHDDDHPDLGTVHFQYEHPETGDVDHTRATFTKSVPAEILGTALQRLFESKIPEYTSREGSGESLDSVGFDR